MLASATAFVAPYVELPSGDKDGIPTAMVEAMAGMVHEGWTAKQALAHL